jgi:hypothetical protein
MTLREPVWVSDNTTSFNTCRVSEGERSAIAKMDRYDAMIRESYPSVVSPSATPPSLSSLLSPLVVIRMNSVVAKSCTDMVVSCRLAAWQSEPVQLNTICMVAAGRYSSGRYCGLVNDQLSGGTIIQFNRCNQRSLGSTFAFCSSVMFVGPNGLACGKKFPIPLRRGCSQTLRTAHAHRASRRHSTPRSRGMWHVAGAQSSLPGEEAMTLSHAERRSQPAGEDRQSDQFIARSSG